MFNRIPLDNKSFTVELTPELTVPAGIHPFKSISDLDIQSAFLQLPMPMAITKRIERTKTTDSESETATTKPNTYLIGRRTYKLKDRYFKRCYQLSIVLTKETKISEQEFNEQYTNKFVERYKANCHDFKFMNYLTTRNQQFEEDEDAGREVDIELLLMLYLYYPIREPLKHTLKLFQRDMMKQMDLFHKLKDIHVSGDSSDVINSNEIRRALYGFGSSLKFLGLTSCPDFTLGYSYKFSEKGELVISATVIGETELTSIELVNCCNILRDCTWYMDELEPNEIRSQPPLGEIHHELPSRAIEDMTRLKATVEDGLQINVDKLGFVRTNITKITELQKIIRRLVTLGCHAGVNKLMITTYCETLLIKIDSRSVVLGTSELDTFTLSDGKPLTLLQSSHYLVRSSDPLARMKIAAFFDVDLQEINSFKITIRELLKQEYAQRLPTPQASVVADIAALSISLDTSNAMRPLILDGDILDAECELDLGTMTKQFLQWGPCLSQVLVVNKQLFISNIAADHLFRIPLRSEEDIVVKVYDPLWAASLHREIPDEEYANLYQESVDLCVAEIQAYSKLEKLAGTVIPRCFGYGTILDSTIGAGKPHIRAEGPAIFLENLESIRDTTFEKKHISSQFTKRIVEAYSELHALGVVHGDVAFRNILVTKDKNVKILDFSHAKIDATPQDIAEELKVVHYCFGTRW